MPTWMMPLSPGPLRSRLPGNHWIQKDAKHCCKNILSALRLRERSKAMLAARFLQSSRRPLMLLLVLQSFGLNRLKALEPPLTASPVQR